MRLRYEIVVTEPNEIRSRGRRGFRHYNFKMNVRDYEVIS
jgi:hypothetical protein